jgi:hypothetical protein
MADTPRDLDVFDAHAHFFSHGFLRALLAMRPGKGEPDDAAVTRAVDGLGLEPPPKDPAALAARWVGELDAHGVPRTVLIASVPSDWPSVAAAVRAFPERFVGYAMANPHAANGTAALEKALDEGGLRGVCLFPAMHHFHVHDHPARQIIEAARKRRALVFCHFGLLQVPIRDRLGVPNDFDGTFAVPTDLHRVAADYPEVTFQVPHFGGGYFRETLLLGAQRPNVVVDSSSSNAWVKLAPYPLDLDAVVRKALDVFGPERILWGSDSSVLPRGWRRDLFDLQTRCFRAAGCDDAAMRKIFGGNLRRILGLDR